MLIITLICSFYWQEIFYPWFRRCYVLLFYQLIYLASVLGLLIVTSTASADLSKPFVDSLAFQVANSKTIGNIIIDNNDRLWFSAYGYLYRYDGNVISAELHTNWLVSHHADAWNRLWDKFRNSNGQFAYHSLTTGESHPIRFVYTDGTELPLSQGFDFTYTADAIWLLTSSGDFYQAPFSADVSDVLVFSKRAALPKPISAIANIKPVLWLDNRGNIWYAHHQDLMRYHPVQNSWTDFSHLLPKNSAPEQARYFTVTPDNTTWMALDSGKILRISEQGQPSWLNLPYRVLDALADPSLDKVWFATNNGLYYISGDNSALQHYSPEPWQAAGIPSAPILALNQDRFGNLWLITSNNKLYVMRSLHNNVSRIQPNLFRSSSKIDAGLQSIWVAAKENQQTLWWFNQRKELVRYDQENGHEQIYNIPIDKQHDIITGLAYQFPWLLLTTRTGKLLRFDTHTRQFLSSTKLFDGDSWANNLFLNNSSNDSNKLWLSRFRTQTDTSGKPQGNFYQLSYWHKDSQSLKNFICQIDNPDPSLSLNGTYLKSQFTFQDTVWFTETASSVNQLLQISASKSRCSNVKPPFTQDVIYATSQTEPNSLWLAQSNHIRRFKLDDKQILYDQATPLSTVEFAVVDKNGNFLVYGDRCLWRFDLNNHSWTPLFASEVVLETNSRFTFDANTGLLYLLTLQGILEIDTNRPMPLPEPHLVFTSMIIGDKKSIFFDKQSELNIAYDQPIEINYLATPNVPSRLLHFRYRFAADQPWIDLKSNNKLSFTRLNPGEFNLEMQTSFSHQDFSKSQYLRFKVIPPWWLSSWAYSLYALLVCSLLYLLIRWQRFKARSLERLALAQERLQLAQERVMQARLAENTFDNTSEGICILSSDYQVIRINGAMQLMLGWNQGDTLTDVLAQSVTLKERIPVADILSNYDYDSPWQEEVTLRSQGGQELLADVRIETLEKNNPNGQIILMAEDISHRKYHEQQLIFLSRHDFLTGLPNRLFFAEHVNRLLENILPPERYALILLDLANFKTINDSFGQQCADRVLQAIANDLAASLQESTDCYETVARQGGDDFWLIWRCDRGKHGLLETRLQALLHRLCGLRSLPEFATEVAVNANVGITWIPDNSTDAHTLLQQAEMALLKAKRNSKSQFAYYATELDKQQRWQIELENCLLHGSGQLGLILHYQPIVDVRSDAIVGVEALARWRLTDGEILLPEQFLSLLRPGKMQRIFGMVVFKQAFLDLFNFQTQQANLKMAINVSPHYLADKDFVVDVQNSLQENEIDPATVIIDIPEDTGFSNPELLSGLKTLRALRIGIAIDDYGTGASSLAHLSQLAATALKIDKRFLQGIPGNKTSENLFKSMLELGKRFNMSVICEGVEEQSQLDFIRASGCTLYQGFYFSHPLASASLQELLDSSQVFNA